MIMFTSKSNRIFAQVIDDYHRCDDVDAPVRNLYTNGSIEYLLYQKNWIDTVQWHLEDIIRDPNIDPVEALKIKRRIDRSNQERTDMVEYIDSYFLDLYKDVRVAADATRPACARTPLYASATRPRAAPPAPYGRFSARGSTAGRSPTPGSRY